MKKNTQKKLLISIVIIIAIALLTSLGTMLFDYLNSKIFIKVQFSTIITKDDAQELLSSYNISLDPGFILPFSGEQIEESDEAIIKSTRYDYLFKLNKLKKDSRILKITTVNISEYTPHLMPL